MKLEEVTRKVTLTAEIDDRALFSQINGLNHWLRVVLLYPAMPVVSRVLLSTTFAAKLNQTI